MAVRLTGAVPALPVRSPEQAAAFYVQRLGFDVVHAEEAFVRLQRDDCELHLWHAADETWRTRADLRAEPVCSGAESFLAGTASVRLEVDDVDALSKEMQAAGVLDFAADAAAPRPTAWGTRELVTTDLDNNLLVFFQRTQPR